MTDPSRSFGAVVDAYDRARPTYPREAAAWLAGDQPTTVLELGAGTGKLTQVLVDLGHDVHATDPDEQMLARLRQNLPDVRTSVASAEDIPAPDAAYDVVVVAQAFHWFDHDRALPEIARVLKPGGRIALVCTQEQLRSVEPLVTSPLFGFVEDQEFRHWQVVDRESIQDLALSRSNVAVLDEEARAAKLGEVLAFYDDYGRGMDGMQLPYVARCYRAPVRADAPRPERPGRGVPGDDESPTESTGPIVDPHPGDDDDLLLIDFR